jgi:polyisoprenoid-binding protein YceI
MKNISINTTTSILALLGALTLGPVGAATTTPGSYKIDPAHTSVSFSVNHLGISTLAGRFNSVEGDITLAHKDGSSIEVSIETASVDTNHEKRDEHLRGPDFFNAKQYPVMKFSASKIDFSGDKSERIKGELSLHGKTKPVMLTVEPIGAGDDPWGGYRAGYKATTVIKRSDFGMDFMPGGFGDDISVTLNIEAIKQ